MSFNKFLAVALLLAAGCDQSGPKPVDASPAKASSQEVAALQSALDAQAKSVSNAVPVKADADGEADDDGAEHPKPEPAVTGFLDGEGLVRLQFNDMPDLGVLNSYVKITPDPGPLVQDWWPWSKTCILKGDFKPRTTYRLVARKGLPMQDGRTTAEDFRRTWTTGDRSKSIAFAHEGRYLPAAGRRLVALKSVNVTNLLCEIRPVPARNIVQLLAREESEYDSYYGGGGDSSNTRELAGEPLERPVRVKGRLNKETVTPLVVSDVDGRAANGVYLVGARADEKPSCESVWRLVCVTDIGLSVREAHGTVYVWATSLTTGRPLPDINVLVYGSNNIVLAEGVTDAEGWCCCELPKTGTRFAVVAKKMDGSDTSFLALRDEIDESIPSGFRRPFLDKGESEAFVWTERGIYRHDEKILVHALLRDHAGNAPKPFPVRFLLQDPEGRDFMTRTIMPDAFGSVVCEEFSVPAEQKSGRWKIFALTPGEPGNLLGDCGVKVEEFVPPQIRVKVTPPVAGGRATSNLVFSVAGEHLFGGPAKGLPVDAAVMFEDAPFAPKGWESFRFGDENRRLEPNFSKLDATRLDADGKASFSADFPVRTRPRAAVRMTVQGSVFESGGRPASARAQVELHAYPFYIGVQLPESLREGKSPRDCRVVLVNSDGTPHRGPCTLTARFERVERVYGLHRVDGGWEWRSDLVRYPMGDAFEVPVAATGLANLPVPVSACGDCAVTLTDDATGVSFGASYWVGGTADGAVRASLENPSRVTLKADRPVYHPGDRPRITVKAPFAGSAWLNVVRDEMVYSQVFALTNATSEIVLEPVTGKWAPGVDVYLSVVQAAKAQSVEGRTSANRAYGVLPLRVATLDSSLEVKVAAKVACRPHGGSDVEVSVEAKGAAATGARAVVTVVDEGIHMLTDQKVPDPAGWFGETRDAVRPLWDIYYRLLPVLEPGLRRAGAKTGGGAEGDLFRRVSPIPTRRFRPLSVWKTDVELKDGRAVVPFSLPEFVGEIRATAVAYNRRATGAGAAHAKVAPNLVAQPDAPRFVAPGDVFLATLTLSNRSGRDGTVAYDLMAGGPLALDRPVHSEIRLADGASETLTFPVRAGQAPGEGSLVFVCEGLGEKHKNEILLPVRPAAPWMQTATTRCLQPGAKQVFANDAGILPGATRRTFLVSAQPVAELAAALAHLVEYPHGCLEQTVSRVFPLISAGGILNTLPVADTSAAHDARGAVSAGIRRVCAMMHANDFSMWPDSATPPWDRDVSLWAAHFLVEAGRAGFDVPRDRIVQVQGYLRRWAMSTNETTSVYACHSLALAGTPDMDRMLYWFDRRASLSSLDRARLARAFVRPGDRARARELLASTSATGVADASFLLLARLDLDPADPEIPALATFLLDRRDARLNHWLTTADNAHALLALGGYYRAHPATTAQPNVVVNFEGNEESIATKHPRTFVGGGEIAVSNRGEGPVFLSVRTLALPEADKAAPEAQGISVRRRFLRTDGTEADLATLVRGEMILVEVSLSAPAKTTYADLVVEELLPACFEPDQSSLDGFPWMEKYDRAWELRRELRDDRVLGFSRRFDLEPGKTATFVYAVRVVSAGAFILPGSSVEAMYAPAIRARGASQRIRVEK